MARMTALMKEFYGEARYNQSKQPDWEQLAKRCTYSPIPEQGGNECGFYMLKVVELYDGLNLVPKLYKRDVIITTPIPLVFLFVMFFICSLFDLFFLFFV